MSDEKGFDFENEALDTEDQVSPEGETKQSSKKSSKKIDKTSKQSDQDAEQVSPHEEFMLDDEQINETQAHEKTQAKKSWFFNGLIGIVILVGAYMTYTSIFPSKPVKKHTTSQSHNLGFKDHVYQTPTNKVIQQKLPIKSFAASSTTPAKPAKIVKRNDNTTTSTTKTSNNYRLMSQEDIKSLASGIGKMVANDNQSLAEHIVSIEKQQAILAQNNSNENKILQNEINRLNATLLDINSKMKDYNTTIKTISHALGITSAQLKVLVAQQADHAQKLTLRAVVQGRAWLVDEDGNTHTVAKGDSIPYYGKVQRIDADNDQVEMSSGYTFT